MTTESKNELINIYLNNQEIKSTILNDVTAERRYIILQNDTLQAENRNLNNRIHDLENQIEELETDSAKMERSATYIKGMLKNFVEVDKLYKIVDKENTQLQSKMTKIYIDMKSLLFTNLIIYKVISMLIFSICFCIGNPSIFFILDNLLCLYIFYEYNSKFKRNTNLSESENTMEIREKIKDIHKSQDYIVDLIDNC